MPDVIISPLAERNLKAIAHYIARDNIDRAMTFTQELRQQCQDLGTLPSRGSSFPTRKSDIRRLVHGNYLIFYRYHESQDTVFILRIDESHRDFSRIVFED